MTSCPDEQLSWWAAVLMSSCPDEQLSWWAAVLMSSCPDEQLPRWPAVLMTSCPDDQLSWWPAVQMTSCPDNQLSWWPAVLMKAFKCPVSRDHVCIILASVQCMCNLLTLQSDSTGGCYGFMDLLSKYFVWHSLIETTEECMVTVHALDTHPHDGHTMQL